MLNGIGGRTIEEAQQKMTYREVVMWEKYRDSRGSLNLGLRIERSVGLLSYNHERANSTGDVSISRHMPYLQPNTSSDPVQKEFAKWGVNYE